MTKTTLQYIAAFASAIAETATRLASDAPASVEQPAAPEADEPRKGRPAKTETPPPVEQPASTPAPAETPAEPEKKPAAEPAKGRTFEELHALMAPLVKAGQGADVIKVIKSYGVDKLKDLKPEHHEAWVRDIEALSI